ncbi:FlgO family outer membrane protein [Nitrincola tapanii]|uniref:FlgO domain-containing protein n=1 Tax=Nitrincola tapanii TaxID=1708751 RepID=A0A5A9W382_9GAMM|nr:FlgO family outer membrane protein [Nitrincola tapanii]KAA0874659.1 hypothetical protein E1H14_07460 [Nitrincola tapanii]
MIKRVLPSLGLISVCLVSLVGCQRWTVPVTLEQVSPQAQVQLQNSLEAYDESRALRQPQPLPLVEAVSPGTDAISEAIALMASHLALGLDEQRVQRLPMAIMPFRRLEARNFSGDMGERLAESFIYQLQHLGYNLVDHRAISLTTTAKLDPDGETLSLLRSRNRIYFILTGTYAAYPDGVVINARVIDTTTRQVLASAQSHIPNQRLEGRWPGYHPLDAIERGMIIENRQGPAGGVW